MAVRYFTLGRFSPEFTILSGQSLEVRLFTMGAVFFEYLRLLLYPRVLPVDFYYHATIGLPSSLSAPWRSPRWPSS